MDQQQQSRWRPTRRQLLWAGATAGLVLLTIAVVIGYRYDITLWDWLKLLIVPVVIAGGGIWFNRQQRQRELEIARQQREQELDIAERRTQDEALQAYLDQMSSMLIPNTGQPSLYKARPGDSLSSVARARTLTVLPRLDGERKARVLQFLQESGLIAKDRPALALSGADLSGADLRRSGLSGAHLRLANLRGASLDGTTSLGEANLSGADLRETDLGRADLSRADLRLAKLNGAVLTETALREADLSRADLSRADLSGNILRGVNLRGANLRGANLRGANLRGANLNEADLRKAYLNEADLSGAWQWTDDQLGAARSLAGATMPNGQQYEDWLKDKENEEAAVSGALQTGDYKGLTVAEVAEKLDGLSIQQLEQVREYEKRNKNRKTLIEQIDHKMRVKNS